MSLSEEAPDVSWERYEYISIGFKKKLMLVRKCTKPGIMFNYFRSYERIVYSPDKDYVCSKRGTTEIL